MGRSASLGYEDFNDEDDLRHDPLVALPVGKSALNRLEHAPAEGVTQARDGIVGASASSGSGRGSCSGPTRRIPARRSVVRGRLRGLRHRCGGE